MAAYAFSISTRYDALPSITSRTPDAAFGQSTRKNSTPLLASSFRGLFLKALPARRTQQKQARLLPLAEAYLVKKVTASELDKLLEGERKSPVVVDFYATWCGPCILLAQELEQLAVEYGDTVKFVKVDTDEEYELANEMEIRGLPTLVFVSKDMEKNAIRTEGLLPSDVIRNIIENEL